MAALAATPGLASPTFTKDVAPILFERCVQCHRPGDIAPMSLLDYKSVRPWAKSIRQAVLSRKMPPWFADPQYGHFANDARLKQRQIETIQAWVDTGAKEGDPKDLPAAPAFPEGWRLGKPGLIVDIAKDYKVQFNLIGMCTSISSCPRILRKASGFELRNCGPATGAWCITSRAREPGGRCNARRTSHHSVDERARRYLERDGKLTRIRMDAPVLNDACPPTRPLCPAFAARRNPAWPGRN